MPKLSAIPIITVFLIAWLLLWLPFAIWGAAKLNWRPFQPSSPAQKLPLLAALYLIAPFVLRAVCWFEGSTFATYGATFQAGLLFSMLQGLVAGSLGLLAVFGLQRVLGWLTWFSPNALSSLPTSVWNMMQQVFLLLLLGLWVGWTEELIFRGFLQTQLEQDYPVLVVATAVSLFFALLHGVWEGRAVVAQLPGLWLMGMVLVLACQVDGGNIGLAWGLHAGWVWTIASLDTLQLIRYTGKAPNWMTGYDAKPLAGAIGLCFLLLTAGGLWAIGQ